MNTEKVPDWNDIQLKLGAFLFQYGEETSPMDRGHFIHWMRRHSSQFFSFFRKQQQDNPERLIAWWRRNQNNKNPSKTSSLEDAEWSAISADWSAYLQQCTLSAA